MPRRRTRSRCSQGCAHHLDATRCALRAWLPIALLSGFGASPALAVEVGQTIEQIEEVVEPGEEPPEPGRWRIPGVNFEIFSGGVLDANYGSAEVSSVRSGGSLELLMPVSERLLFRLEGGAEVEVFDFEGSNTFLMTGVPGGEPFDDLIASQVRLRSHYAFNETWGGAAIAFVTSRRERGADFSDSIQAGGVLGVSYARGETLRLLLGLGISSRMDKSTPGFFPLIQARWDINDTFRLESDGIGARASARLAPGLRGYVFGRFHGRRYRLEDRKDGPAGVQDGSLRDRRLPVGAGLRWGYGKLLRLKFETGALVYQQYRVADDGGDTVDKVSIDNPAFFAGLRVQLRFRP